MYYSRMTLSVGAILWVSEPLPRRRNRKSSETSDEENRLVRVHDTQAGDLDVTR